MDFLFPLLPYLTLATPHILSLMLIFARIGVIVFFLPGIGERFISSRVRLSAAIAFTLLVYPLVSHNLTFSLGQPANFILHLLSEVLNGMIFGILIRLLIFALQTAGAIISQSLSLAQLFSPTFSNDAETPYGTFLMFSAIALGLSAGLHIKVVIALNGNFEALPLGQTPDLSLMMALIVDHFQSTFKLAFEFASPFIIIGLIYNLVIGAANRAMPQLLASLVGAPGIAWLGLIIFALTVPQILGVWQSFLNKTLLLVGGLE